jgi:hypothetical protein
MAETERHVVALDKLMRTVKQSFDEVVPQSEARHGSS